MSLAGEHVAVLGGTSGIGLAVATAAAGLGAEVTVVSGNPDRVERAVTATSHRLRGAVADLTDGAQVRTLFEDLGALDHLAFTAGDALLQGRLADLEPEAIRKYFELRYFGLLTAVQAAAPRFRSAGSLTFVSGTVATRPSPGTAVPASVVGAIEGLTRALAVELAPLRVNTIQPGIVRSPLWAGMTEAARDQLFRETAAANPLHRIAEPSDIARGFVYFMTQPHATGTVLTIDGGGLLT
ncbi:SDR family oxidoreductase [Nocardia sp. 2]|uniref:SDR family oxidoreductase n=1 Tax=Nocardia acididurans TaxID=2802282 RepID=A0ABS1MGZ1_9NOCA|nr:SDR family oxidoreductase [Nocardia acididurans]MBL1079938.1 SDR family oxidoreductase [Nocardia acididurans]